MRPTPPECARRSAGCGRDDTEVSAALRDVSEVLDPPASVGATSSGCAMLPKSRRHRGVGDSTGVSATPTVVDAAYRGEGAALADVFKPLGCEPEHSTTPSGMWLPH